MNNDENENDENENPTTNMNNNADIPSNTVASVLPVGETTVITQEPMTFDEQTEIVKKSMKDNEKQNTVACFSPKESEFKKILRELYSSTQPTTWHLITEEKVK